MKLGTCVFLGAAGLMSLGLTSVFTLQGCSGSSSNAPTDGGTGATGATGDGGGATGGGDGGGSGPGTVPPPAPTGPATTSTTPHNFALHHIHLGDELDSSGNPDWAKYGYNLSLIHI